MNRESFYVGLGMLVAPFLVYLAYLLVLSKVDWGLVVLCVLGFAYFGTALFLLIKGALTENLKGGIK